MAAGDAADGAVRQPLHQFPLTHAGIGRLRQRRCAAVGIDRSRGMCEEGRDAAWVQRRLPGVS